MTSRSIRSISVVLAVVLLGSVVAPVAAAELQMGAPTVVPRLNGRVDVATVPLAISWPIAPASGSSLSSYTLQHSTDGSTWAAVRLANAKSRSVVVRVRPWLAHSFRVRATYANGQQTAWATTGPQWLSYADENDLATTYTGSWTTLNGRKAHNGSRRVASSAGASASYVFTGSQIVWIARYGPNRGRARVYVDDKLMATVDLRRARVKHRRVAFHASWPQSAARTLRIEVEGTAGRPYVDVDGFVVLGPPASETIVGAGDIAYCSRTAQELTAQLIEGIEGIVYTTGDNAYPNGTAAEFANCYDPSWGRFKGRTRPSPGNHDYATSGAAPYYAYFGLNAGPPGRGWYTYQAGTWRIYSLNSEVCGSSNNRCVPGAAQYEWLKADLTANPHQCVAAYWHRPRFTSGYHSGSSRMAAIIQLLYENGADVVLAGHNHFYERLERVTPTGELDDVRGIRHFIVGTGGAGLYKPQDQPLPITATRQEFNDEVNTLIFGVLRLDLHPGAYDWEFVPTSAGVYTDSGSGSCH